jgi:hypothetical protein
MLMKGLARQRALYRAKECVVAYIASLDGFEVDCSISRVPAVTFTLAFSLSQASWYKCLVKAKSKRMTDK